MNKTLPSVCCLTPGTLTLAPSPKAKGASVVLPSSSLSFASESFVLSASVLVVEAVGDVTCVCEEDNALVDVAATAAKGEVVALANDPKEGTEVVAFFSDSLAALSVDAAVLNPPKPELLLNPPKVGC